MCGKKVYMLGIKGRYNYYVMLCLENIWVIWIVDI